MWKCACITRLSGAWQCERVCGSVSVCDSVSLC